jgi:EpsI family protein
MGVMAEESSPKSMPPQGAVDRRALVRTALIASVAMVVASGAAMAVRPKPRDPSAPPSIVLETAIPKAFGDWREVPQAVQVVNPQTQELLDKLYSQTLSRTYLNTKTGYRIMLSLAYGDDQRGGLQAHMPEVCYPAQGFKLIDVKSYAIATPFGQVQGKRVRTSLGPRDEPLTYWFAMGDQSVKSAFDKRLVELRLGLTGQVPDGLLFRVSSIDADHQRAFSVQEEFIADLLSAIPEATRQRIAGLAMPVR